MFVAILQARMACSRLPGKAMAPLAGEPMIWRQIERLRGARRLSRVMVATSDQACDDTFAGYLVSRGQSVFRGSATDLLDRFARCAEALAPATHVVRVKGDAPFVDPALIDLARSRNKPALLARGALDDASIASVLTYIRQSWGHNAPPVSPESVAKVRAAVGNREEPWSDEELLTITN